MKKTFKSLIIVLVGMTLLMACDKHDKDEPFKPLEKRTILLLTNKGEIYNQDYELVQQLPKCTFANRIISEGDDYFVSGTHEKKKVGYWKNGKWTTLHVDFIDDVEHWIDGMSKWDYYIYLLDYPHVLKNSGIYRLEDGERFLPATQALEVSEGRCYVVGCKRTDESGYEYLPALYTEHKGVYTAEILPMAPGAVRGDCTSVYAYDKTHTLIGGSIDGWPVIWVDKQLHILPLTEMNYEDERGEASIGEVSSITECGGNIYAVGSEIVADQTVATIWINGILHHLTYFPNAISAEAAEVETYGNDVYVLTHEYYFENGEFIANTIVWLNNQVLKVFRGLDSNSFTIL